MDNPTVNDQQADAPKPLTKLMCDPQVTVGRACIRGMRVTVAMIVGQIGTGRTIEGVLTDFPYLEREVVLESLQYATWLSQELEIVLATG